MEQGSGKMDLSMNNLTAHHSSGFLFHLVIPRNLCQFLKTFSLPIGYPLHVQNERIWQAQISLSERNYYFVEERIDTLNTTSCENGSVRLILTFGVKETNYLDLQESPVTHKWHKNLTALFGNLDPPVGFVFLAHLSKRYKTHRSNKMVKWEQLKL